MVIKIVGTCPAYYSAIHESTETAQQGCFFAKDAVDFCKSLVEGKASLEILEEGLEDIKKVAMKAYQGSKQMNEKFRIVRVELFDVRS